MWLILWVIQALLNSIWMILTKKVVENKKVWNNIQTLFSRFNHLIILLLIINLWFFNFDINSSTFWFLDILLLIFATISLYITYPLRRIAYANEKISTLQPFAMLFQVFPVIIGFIFIATERANFITFLFAILASFIVIIPNIDYKTFKINKFSLMVLISSIIRSFHVFATVYFLTKLNAVNFYLLETILIILFSIFLILLKWEFKEFKLLDKKYIKLLTTANTISVWSVLIALTMYTTIWIIATSLLSLLYLVFVYILSYFILWEKPSKKDIIISTLVSICVALWMFFKL